jgi:GrpB-like predicted nucleotidyltransferase (UPF0157 family)
VILIEPYCERWPDDFRRVAKRLRAALGERASRIDHIGSTSVPGLAAKPVIDVQVTVAKLEDAGPLVDDGLDEIVPAWDHRPPGATGPEPDWQKRLFVRGAAPKANVHVRVAGRPNQRYALLFRDYLRAHPQAAEAYAELKRRLAREVRDVGTYADVKDPACDLVAIAAEAWAAATRWEPGPADA